jgi:hypothetical protein
MFLLRENSLKSTKLHFFYIYNRRTTEYNITSEGFQFILNSTDFQVNVKGKRIKIF